MLAATMRWKRRPFQSLQGVEDPPIVVDFGKGGAYKPGSPNSVVWKRTHSGCSLTL